LLIGFCRKLWLVIISVYWLILSGSRQISKESWRQSWKLSDWNLFSKSLRSTNKSDGDKKHKKWLLGSNQSLQSHALRGICLKQHFRLAPMDTLNSSVTNWPTTKAFGATPKIGYVGSKMKIWKPPSAQFYLNAIFNTNSRPEKNLNFVRFHMESAKKHEKPVVFWNFPDQNGHNLNVFLAGLKVKYFLKSTFHCWVCDILLSLLKNIFII